jgi:hypothetical protein
MAVIHRTTLVPSKIDLLATWLPTRTWYTATGREPKLVKAGGFRLDDPEGEVGIDFMVVGDVSADRPRAYHVPMTYRGAPLDGGEDALIGVAEHGVLGRRWIYDGSRDPVLVTRVLALLRGEAEPQAQSISNTPDPSVTVCCEHAGIGQAIASMTASDNAAGTLITVDTVKGDEPARVSLRVLRRLDAAEAAETPGSAVSAGWRLADDSAHRGPYLLVESVTRMPED